MVYGQAGGGGRITEPEGRHRSYFGRLTSAREFSRRAMDSAERAGEKGTVAAYSAVSALREALYGNADEARRCATFAIERSAGRDVQYGVALARAYAGDDLRARAMMNDLGKSFCRSHNRAVELRSDPRREARRQSWERFCSSRDSESRRTV